MVVPWCVGKQQIESPGREEIIFGRAIVLQFAGERIKPYELLLNLLFDLLGVLLVVSEGSCGIKLWSRAGLAKKRQTLASGFAKWVRSRDGTIK